jgi:cell division protease FtsH
MVIKLLEKETLNKEEIAEIFAKVKSWPSRPAWTGSQSRAPSSTPPVDIPERKVEERTDAPKKARRVKKATSE